MKRGQLNIDFQSRYFVLRNGKLSYFEAPKDTSPRGVIELKGAKLHVDFSNELKIIVPNRVYVMRAQSNAERDEWMSALVTHGAIVETQHGKAC
jgi:hypothetical protein